MSKKTDTARRAESLVAAERAAQIRRQHEDRERRRRNLLVSLGLVAALVLVTGVFAALQASRDTTGEAATAPAGAVDEYAVPLGPADAPVTVEVYEDFLCPFCGEYEAATSRMLQEHAAAGDVHVQYRVVSFLDRASSDDYSTRSANALAVVLDQAGPEVAVAFHDLLFENQPAEGGAGLSDDHLVALAGEAGADESAVRGPIESLAFGQWVKNATEAASERGINGTPTVLVDGEPLEGATIDELAAQTEAAIQAAR